MELHMAWGRLEKALIDAICICSGVGIWPRFIEPRIILKKHIKLTIPEWRGRALRVLHLSDLHLDRDSPLLPIQRALSRAAQQKPDLVLWTGDFLVDADTHDWHMLRQLLSVCRGTFGTYACLGNHDYGQYCFHDGGSAKQKSGNRLYRILRRLSSAPDSSLASDIEPQAPHPQLLELLSSLHIEVLHNQHTICDVAGQPLTIAGIGDPLAGCADSAHRCWLDVPRHPSLLLCHNPDIAGMVPGDWSLILAGHTHGRQVNLPWLSRRLTRSVTPYTRGLYQLHDTTKLYVSRGLGSSLPFRLFSPPEVTWLHIN